MEDSHEVGHTLLWIVCFVLCYHSRHKNVRWLLVVRHRQKQQLLVVAMKACHARLRRVRSLRGALYIQYILCNLVCTISPFSFLFCCPGAVEGCSGRKR